MPRPTTLLNVRHRRAGAASQFAICNLQFAICNGAPIRFRSDSKSARARRPRSAFSLLEVTLVLGILVVMAAIVWPAFDKPFAAERLRKGADKVRTEWVRSRIKAMTSGVPHVFRYQPETGNFQIETWAGLETDLEAASASAFAPPQQGISAQGAPGAPQQGTQGVITSIETGLPAGVVFFASEAGLDARSLGVTGGAVATDGWSQPVFFYPDGTTSNAQLLLRNENDLYIKLQLRGLTGIATVSDVLSAEEITQ